MKDSLAQKKLNFMWEHDSVILRAKWNRIKKCGGNFNMHPGTYLSTFFFFLFYSQQENQLSKSRKKKKRKPTSCIDSF